MLTLILIGLLSGIVTGLSPCILPVLPAVLATTAIPAGLLKPGEEPPPPDRLRPFIVIGGLVTSFAVFTLIGGSLLNALGLPADLLRNIGIASMIVVGIGFLIPAVGHLLERPFARFSTVGPRKSGSAFLFGATFGLAFVPCAGPVLATITVLAATNQVQAGLIALTIAFSVGVAIPLLAFALAGQQMTSRISAVRSHMPALRRATGAILIVTALAVFFGVADQLQRLVPSYVASAQQQIESNPAAQEALGSLKTAHQTVSGTAVGDPAVNNALGPQLNFADCANNSSQLANCGPAPAFTGIKGWLNTPGGAPLSIAGLKGKVVLVDFWTYSCINCQRTLPYLEDWDAKYRKAGLTIVGVHSPEFAFEHEIANVTSQAAKLGVQYPIAIDNDFSTWQNYDQSFWPAHYLIDRNGTVRQVHYGEGGYAETEALIKTLLGKSAAAATRTTSGPATTEVAAMARQTPETYLGAERASAFTNHDYAIGTNHVFHASSAPAEDRFSLDGTWTVAGDSIKAGPGASLQLRYTANVVYLVLGGEGTVQVEVNGKPGPAIEVHGAPTLYTVDKGKRTNAVLTLKPAAGISQYAFTFG